MTPARSLSTLISMVARRLAWGCLVLPLALGCDGAYVLGDAHSTSPGASGQGAEGNNGGGGASSGSAPSGEAGQVGQAGDEASGAGGGEAATFTLSPTSLPAARLNREYEVQFSAHGGTGPYRFSLASGTLPLGLELEPDGSLLGAPAEEGEFELVVQATDVDGAIASADLLLSVTRARWLATQTFPSSASTQVLLSLTDLLDPDAEPIRIESQSAHAATFSPDGRWLIYYSFRSMEEVDWYIVDTAGEAPSERQFLLTNHYAAACTWAPDSSKLACPEQSGDESRLVYFDATGATLGSKRYVADADRFAWLDGNTMVYASGSGPYSRRRWNAGVLAEPEPLGMSGLIIERQDVDGRAVVTVEDSDDLQSLVDFQLGQAMPLPDAERFTLSDSFDVAVAVTPDENDPDLATYQLYWVSGVTWALVGEVTGAMYTRYSPYGLPLFDNRLVLVRGDQVSVAIISDTGVEELVVPDSFADVRSVELSVSGRWLYVETGERNPQNQLFLPETIQHFLSFVRDEEPAQLVGEGFVSGTRSFSPDSRSFLLTGYDSYSDSAVPFYLFEVEAGGSPTKHVLDIPLNWAETKWSDDSTFVSLLGGSPTRSSRILFIVDALAPADPPRTMFECFSNPAPLPGCPNIPVLQP